MKKRFSLICSVRYFFLATVMSLGSLSLPAAAMDIPFFQSNDILYYDPSGATVCTSVGMRYSTSSDPPVIRGQDNAEIIWNFLINPEFGLSPEQVAGIMGNIQRESDFNPALRKESASSYMGTSLGIMQWSGTRLQALTDGATQKGANARALQFQLLFMIQESQDRRVNVYTIQNMGGSNFWSVSDSELDALKKITSIEDATKFWYLSYKGATRNDSEINARIDSAKEILERFNPEEEEGSTANDFPFQGNRCSAVGSGDLIATLLEYAWPEHHPAPYIEMMPGYREAVTRAQSEGRGVGGIAHPGIDCAGFVSLLIVDSGFDPEYNTRGTYATPGATGEAIQRSWMEQHWQSIGTGGSINVADLQPGDVAVTRQGSGEHIFLYVGQIDGFGSVYASASLDERAPMAGGTYETATEPAYDWFRKK